MIHRQNKTKNVMEDFAMLITVITTTAWVGYDFPYCMSQIRDVIGQEKNFLITTVKISEGNTVIIIQIWIPQDGLKFSSD